MPGEGPTPADDEIRGRESWGGAYSERWNAAAPGLGGTAEVRRWLRGVDVGGGSCTPPGPVLTRLVRLFDEGTSRGFALCSAAYPPGLTMEGEYPCGK